MTDAEKATHWLRRCAASTKHPGMRANYGACARLITHLESEMTHVGKIAAAATAALAATPTLPDPSLVIDQDDVAALNTLAAKVNVDPSTGNPLTPATSATPATPAAQS